MNIWVIGIALNRDGKTRGECWKWGNQDFEIIFMHMYTCVYYIYIVLYIIHNIVL